jgi:hypothetical protein
MTAKAMSLDGSVFKDLIGKATRQWVDRVSAALILPRTIRMVPNVCRHFDA